MGCGRSRYFHDDERGVPDGVLLVAPLTEQRLEVVRDLDTDNDQKGRVAVDNIFRPTREIYGQKAEDMTGQAIDWKEYGIVFKSRPRPQDFPAFANAKLLLKMMQQKTNEDKQEDVQNTPHSP
uniref:Overexpressed in colon carcinoma 1 protein n=1 Tax=Ascaris lumbricoides TaxID=6252 RepID=A0A0M3II18_ASCLU